LPIDLFAGLHLSGGGGDPKMQHVEKAPEIYFRRLFCFSSMLLGMVYLKIKLRSFCSVTN